MAACAGRRDSMMPAEPGQQGGQWGMWVAALGAAAHSRDLFCCANRVEVAQRGVTGIAIVTTALPQRTAFSKVHSTHPTCMQR